MNYRVVMTGWNCGPWVRRAMESVERQTVRSFTVSVTDDASSDDMGALVKEFCEDHDWTYHVNTENMGTLWNQVRSIRELCDDPEDVIVFVDADDSLIDEQVFAVLDQYYRTGVDMTYGSYISEPYSETCAPARPWPEYVRERNSYRHFSRYEGGIYYNHLRTFKYKLFLGMNDGDFTYADGTWLRTAPDSALMFPAFELSGGNWAFVSQSLYVYNSENGSSDWRRWPKKVDEGHARILDELQPKVP